MAHYVALRDRRLSGGVPARPHLSIINADASVQLGTVFGQINGVARNVGTIHSMFILCHGFAGANVRAAMSCDCGGMGLQLGKENVLHSNVFLWEAIKNKVTNIVVYSCAAGNTERGNEGTTSDGRYLMGALALHTGAHVFAADRIQWYGTHKGLANGRYDFGDWEGQLYYFPPDGSTAQATARPPVEFSDVMGGTAP